MKRDIKHNHYLYSSEVENGNKVKIPDALLYMLKIKQGDKIEMFAHDSYIVIASAESLK